MTKKGNDKIVLAFYNAELNNFRFNLMKNIG